MKIKIINVVAFLLIAGIFPGFVEPVSPVSTDDLACRMGYNHLGNGQGKNSAENLNVFSNTPNIFEYLIGLADQQFDIRSQEINNILTAEDVKSKIEERQHQLKQNYLKIIGDLPKNKTPLNASAEGIIDMEDYKIEKITYQSRPDFYVTANLYLPTSGTGSSKYPGVILLMGHSMAGKAAELYQKAAILLAKNGIVALSVDPIGQAERFQFVDTSGNKIKNRDAIKHCIIDANSLLVGRSMVGYMLWDNIRGIDYLLSREEVDGSRIGVTGNSGGGTQTTFLMAMDDRISVAAPSCYIMTEQRKFHVPGPADCCQYLPFAGQLVPEHADYITMFAPKPVIILGAEKDMFDINATSATFREAKRVYKAFGVPEKVDMFASIHKHGFYKTQREMMVWWMRRWLLNDDTPVIEPELVLQTESDLLVTSTGYVTTNWEDAMTTADLNMRRAKELAGSREEFRKEHSESEFLEKIAYLIGLRRFTKQPGIEKTGIIKRDGYRIEKLIINHEHGIPVPGLLYIPEGVAGKMPATLYVDGRGKSREAGTEGRIAELVNEGRIVLTIDVRGIGELTDPRPMRFEDQRRIAIPSLFTGHSLIGQRVEDVLAALAVLSGRSDVKENDITLIGIGQTGPVVLHAAAFDSRCSNVVVWNSIKSFIDLLKSPLSEHQFPYVVPFALKYYDLPDLMGIIKPRNVDMKNCGRLKGDKNYKIR